MIDFGRTEDQQQPEDNASEQRDRNDLDSIEVGAPTKGGKLKLYFDTSKDSQEEIQRRIDLQIVAMNYARERIGI